MDDELFLQKNGEAFKEMKLLLLELQKTLLLLGENQKFYDNADLKSLLNVSDRTLYRMRKMNKIPFFKVGNKYYYPKQFFNQMAL
ncbi:helix-turn-helix domain-containing protein [Empedobacter tilapiae]|uniref:DNA-binding protein n=1 Tax=Empedobacter tilapiae TaxID=2491114 RepID=A0A4Z1B8G6_9FLAO|nr:helix-turn-helix domain-containing protein [Empedobacter tilapiae]TGN24604.1 DNA-binding protein [Empedobacter tilapiae]